jgi:hypothetical protein
LPPCGQYLATSNISPDNKVNTKYNSKCFENEPYATSGRQKYLIDEAFHRTTSSGEYCHEWPAGRKGPSVGSIVQLTIQKEACHGALTGIALFTQQREIELDQGLCGARDRRSKKASSRHRDSDDARAGTYGKC